MSRIYPIAVGVALWSLAQVAIGGKVEWRFPTDRITPEQWATYRAETLAKPDVRHTTAPQQDVYFVPAEDVYYVFTQPGHPAHPAVVMRGLVAQGSSMFIDRKGHFAGSEVAFAVWWKQFEVLDAEFKTEGLKKSQ